jgi:hypothetical protein
MQDQVLTFPLWYHRYWPNALCSTGSTCQLTRDPGCAGAYCDCPQHAPILSEMVHFLPSDILDHKASERRYHCHEAFGEKKNKPTGVNQVPEVHRHFLLATSCGGRGWRGHSLLQLAAKGPEEGVQSSSCSFIHGSPSQAPAHYLTFLPHGTHRVSQGIREPQPKMKYHLPMSLMLTRCTSI